MSGLTKEQKTAKREENKRPTHNDKTPPWRAVWNSRNGPAKRLTERPYRGKSERRQVIKERRERKASAAA